MTNSRERPEEGSQASRSKFSLLVLVFFHSIVYCASLIVVSQRQFYILYDADRLPVAIAGAAACSLISLLFVFARFSFGYFAGFYFYTLILGFIWIDTFSKYNYNKVAAALSAAASLVLFLIPAVLIRAPFKYRMELSPVNFDRLLRGAFALGAVTVAAASLYNFRLVSLARIYDFRNEIEFPAALRYLIGINTSTLLPFAFAGFVAIRRPVWATLTLLVLLLYYPITLSKFAFFASTWLVLMLVLSKLSEARRTVILTLFVPILIGLIAAETLATAPRLNDYARAYFNIVNIRMLAIPSSALDIYNEYFSYHPLTYFCQISFLKTLTHCPYQAPLAVVMENTYGFGNLNASLFATEGVASVGLWFAPLTALVCGLVIAIGNRASANLPHRFILISGALLPQSLINVPFTTALLTYGATLLFLLWYITPRDIFAGEQKAPP
jgi:hypothetical protein